MNFKNALVRSLILLALLFQACSKNNPVKEKEEEKPQVEEEKPGPFANKLRGHHKIPAELPHYVYNSDGTLDRMNYYENGKLSSVIRYYYKNGKPASTTFAADYKLGDTLTISHKSIITMSGDQITGVTEDWFYIDSPQGVQFTKHMQHTFGYDNKGFVKSCTIDITEGRVEASRVFKFTTDEKGNIVKYEQTNYSRGEYEYSSVVLIEYDDKINPEYKLISPLRLPLFFSPNNAIKSTDQANYPYDPSTTTYTYKYNAAGYPVEKLVKWANNSPQVIYYDYYK